MSFDFVDEDIEREGLVRGYIVGWGRGWGIGVVLFMSRGFVEDFGFFFRVVGFEFLGGIRGMVFNRFFLGWMFVREGEERGLVDFRFIYLMI